MKTFFSLIRAIRFDKVKKSVFSYWFQKCTYDLCRKCTQKKFFPKSRFFLGLYEICQNHWSLLSRARHSTAMRMAWAGPPWTGSACSGCCSARCQASSAAGVASRPAAGPPPTPPAPPGPGSSSSRRAFRCSPKTPLFKTDGYVRDIQRFTHDPLLFSVAQGIFWLSTERLSRSTVHNI